MAIEVHPNPKDRSIGELLGDLSRETATLIRQEVTLAKTELTDKATKLGKNAGLLAVGGALAYAGLLALIGAAVLGLMALGLAAWAAALIVGLSAAIIGGGMALTAINAIKKVDVTPHETLRTLKEDQEWAKNRIG